MTTVAFKSGVLAADSFCWEGDTCAGRVQKCGVLADGSLWAFTGNVGQLNRCRPWLACPLGDPPEIKETSLIVVTTEGEVKEWDENGWQTCEAPFYAWGTGANLARGAMAFGATAEQAVLIACDFDAFTGGEVRALALAPAGPQEEAEPEVGLFDNLPRPFFIPDDEYPPETLRERLGLE